MREVFNREEAAEYMGVCPTTVTNLCRRGELRHVKFARSIRIRKEWCIEFLEANAAGGDGHTPAADSILPKAAG